MIVDRDACWAKSFWVLTVDHLCLNQTLEIALHTYVMGLKADWVKWLPALAFTYNSTPQTSMGYCYSPFFLLYGHEPRSPARFASKDSHRVLRPLYNWSAQDFMQELEVHQALARDSLAKATSWQAQAHNSHHHSDEFTVGNETLVKPHSLDLVDVKGTG